MAAVEIFELSAMKISGTATGHNGVPRSIKTKYLIDTVFTVQYMRRRIEVVITGRTRNAFALTGT